MIARIEDIEAERIDGAGRPEPERIHVAALPTDDRRVIGDRLHRLVRMPDGARATRREGRHLHEAAKPDVVGDLRALEFPRVPEREPVLRIFLLDAVLDHLAEEAVI